MTSGDKKRVKFGPFEADLGTGELWKSGLRVKLGGQPFEILATLLANPGELVTREELQKKIWPADTVVDFSHGLNAAVNKLRDALADDPDAPRYVETMPRRGYRYIGPAVEVAAARTASVLVVEPVSVERQELGALVAPAAAGEGVARVQVSEEHNLLGGGEMLPRPVPALDPKPRNPGTSAMRSVLRYAAGILALAVFSIFSIAAFNKWERARSEALERREREVKFEAESAQTPGLEIQKPDKQEMARKGKQRDERVTTVSESVHKPGIWQTLLTRDENGIEAQKLILELRGRTEGPQPSPDGKKLAFMSDRSGPLEIWVSNADGSDAKRLTHLGNCGAPQWSPDGRWIAFDSYGQSGSRAYVVAATGEPVTAPIEADMESYVPRWSRDGKWIYFAGERGDDTQVWKVALAGGRAVQLTRGGGFAAYESYDGKMLYYAKSRGEYPEVWEIPVAGGEERAISPLLRPSTWANWTVTDNGILYLSGDVGDRYSVEFYDFATRGARPVTSLQGPSFWLAASREGRAIWYGQ
jgi:Tol biopolymer transport system component/DNA-binding winged helix-turn-helix (wHTH) protein